MRPLPVEPTIPPAVSRVEGDEYRVIYRRPDDTLYVTFLRVATNRYALCEWDTSDN